MGYYRNRRELKIQHYHHRRRNHHHHQSKMQEAKRPDLQNHPRHPLHHQQK
jgi:hypothetical protein